VSTSSGFTIAAIAARETRAVATVDFPGAYLINSDMPTNSKPVMMSWDPYMTEVLIKIEPNIRKYVNSNDTFVVRVVKGLYGLIEAAKLWLDKLTGLFIVIFTQTPFDPCVMNCTDSDGKQTTLASDVDDVLITAPSEDAISALLSDLETHYPGLSVNRRRGLNYFTEDKNIHGRICE
jgi:hypothetical protein